MKLNKLKTPAACLEELLNLEAGGGIIVDAKSQITPLSEKAKHLAARIIELGGRNCPEYNRLADVADWGTRVVAHRAVAGLFAPTIVHYEGAATKTVTTVRLPNRGGSQAEMKVHRVTGGHRPGKRRPAHAA